MDRRVPLLHTPPACGRRSGDHATAHWIIIFNKDIYA